ncbi:phosphopantothenoylcysteine decarboxylase domain-containing protein [Puniceicoccus vermicola]|uniref:Phosphopantothenoylcysteine decarboxylase n=1 Tax=Puniceicoccus vermicola TaxID=388746 RepID=A0A7X1AZ52_9BACT|nr:phosphopantothenoylcysteine decarboxylase [Puniceicoccus vermicola]
MSFSSPLRCVITAGPTREPIDPVRYISNPSTGKMGYAIAQAAVDAGWTVDLVSGPTHLREPEECILYPVVTGEEMYHQVDALFDACDILIMTAAIVDFRPKSPLAHKEKKGDAQLNIEMEPVIDVLKTVSQRKKDQFLVGFAAETNDLENYAMRKLKEKNLDLIAANLIGSGSGFALDSNILTILGPDGFREKWPAASKESLGRDLVALVTRKMEEGRTLSGS